MKRILPLLALLIFNSCDTGSDFVNLKSDLGIESPIVGAKEGGTLYFNLNLSERLSKNLLLTAKFSIEGIPNYTNGDKDYDSLLEYSNDEGESWKKISNNNQVIFEKGTRNMKVRIITKDDDLLEITESFKLQFTPVKDADLELTNKLEDITCIIEDNDYVEPNIFHNPDALMEFSFSGDTDGEPYKIVRIKQIISEVTEKEIIDGKYKQVLEDVLAVTKESPVNLVTFELLYDHATGIGGYVAPSTSAADTEDKWLMGLNASFAFITVEYDDDGVGKLVPQDYNANGDFGSILVHETGHLLTLNYADQVYTRSVPPRPCSTLVLERIFFGGNCAKPDSHINLFNDEFYPDATLKAPKYVSTYAMTDIAEDIAESFKFYVVQDKDTVSNLAASDTSGALRKIYFIKDQTALEPLRATLRKMVTTSLVYPDEPIRGYNMDRNGKYISCLNYRKLMELQKDK